MNGSVERDLSCWTNSQARRTDRGVKRKPRNSSLRSTRPGRSKLRGKGWIVVLLAVTVSLGGCFVRKHPGEKAIRKSAHVGRSKSAPANQPTKSGGNKVVGVHDGDTITIYTGSGPRFKVRLQGIDAPEWRQRRFRLASD